MAHHHCHGGEDGHGGHHHHDHGEDPAVKFSLYTKIDTERVMCWNEAEEGSGRTVFTAWEDRMDRDEMVESDVDPELLFHIPFTGSVKLKGVVVIGGEDEQHPKELRLFKNRPPNGFDQVQGQPEQTIQLSHDYTGSVEYPTMVSRFNSVSSLLMYFPVNYGAETSIIYYIGLYGEYSVAHRHGVTIATYEARANPADHKITDHTPAGSFVS
ncbi:PITH domain-containing protein 1 [Geodia barretti]|uniref:PITH domain-containing protein 1 n=1 Tax=Geodia barretti TaxID=519541 RepID=A0AA35T2Q8_GEOBA|nr:PITH domain-containing protein 1 [Geodia barretti]